MIEFEELQAGGKVRRWRVADFFRCGGLSVGWSLPGWPTSYRSRRNAKALETYSPNFPKAKVILADLGSDNDRRVVDECRKLRVNAVVGDPRAKDSVVLTTSRWKRSTRHEQSSHGIRCNGRGDQAQGNNDGRGAGLQE